MREDALAIPPIRGSSSKNVAHPGGVTVKIVDEFRALGDDHSQRPMAWSSVGGSIDEVCSPSTTVRSTPPLDSTEDSPISHFGARQSKMGQADFIDIAASNAEGSSMCPSSDSGMASPLPRQMQRMLDYLQGNNDRGRSARVGVATKKRLRTVAPAHQDHGSSTDSSSNFHPSPSLQPQVMVAPPFQRSRSRLDSPPPPYKEITSSTSPSRDITALWGSAKWLPAIQTSPPRHLDRLDTSSAPPNDVIDHPSSPQETVPSLPRLTTLHQIPCDEEKSSETPHHVPVVSPTLSPSTPFCFTKEDLSRVTDNKGRETPRSVSPTRAEAAARLESEGDIEQGTLPRVTPEVEAEAAVISTTAEVRTQDLSPADSELVLPCAPTDEEKVMYTEAHRFAMLSTGLFASCTLSIGMWLCTLASPYLFWFGVPAVIVVFYVMLHFMIAGRGNNFDGALHEETLRKAAGVFPTVDVFLPVCNEPTNLLANTWNYIKALDYPHIAVHVLDDGAKDEVQALAGEYGFQYIRRDDRPHLKKAGNLRYAFARTSGEAIVIFDADFCPRSDFLKETVPYFMDPTIGILQTPQYFRWRSEQTWIEKGAGVSQEFFYRLEQMNRDGLKASVCVGTCGVYRRAAVESFGGVAAVEHSEDIYTGFKMTELGFKIHYLPLCLAMGICPSDPSSFFQQQYRWCMGTVTLVLKKDFWRSSITALQKLCFINGLIYYLTTVLFVFLAPLPILMLIIFKADAILWYHTGFAVPSILFATIVVPRWSRTLRGSTFGHNFWRSSSMYRVKVIQSYAHMYAIKDALLGNHAPWVPSGTGSSTRKTPKAYNASVRLLVIWNTVAAILVVGGAAIRMTEFPWYHYVPSVALVVSTTVLSFSTLWY